MTADERAASLILERHLDPNEKPYIAEKIRQAERDVRALTIRELDIKYNNFCEKKVKEALEWAEAQHKNLDRAIKVIEKAREEHNRRSTDRQV